MVVQVPVSPWSTERQVWSKKTHRKEEPLIRFGEFLQRLPGDRRGESTKVGQPVLGKDRVRMDGDRLEVLQQALEHGANGVGNATQ